MIWSQTAVKDLEKETTCPFRWKSQWKDEMFYSMSNEDMDRGKYFEQILLGQSANKNEIITDLPRLDNGTKSTDQIRIEAQAARGKRLLYEDEDPEWLGFGVVSTQLPLKIKDRSGTADILAIDKSGMWLIDVKLTRDLTNTRTEYGWGNDLSKMDLMQLVHYKDLYEEMHHMEPPVHLGILIFDYSPKMRVKFAEIIVSPEQVANKEQRFKMAKEVEGLYDKNGWVKIPSEKECDGCPLVCSDRIVKSKVIKEVINY